ncbi:hypothetical protein Dimus_018288, partial [Dionaea muscipula]
MANIGKDSNSKAGECWDMVVFEDPIVVEGPQPIPPIHGQFEQAVRSILDGMDRQNEGIKELFELLESKTITDNQKERLTMGHLKEAKSYLENITEQIRLLKIALKRTIMD